MKFWKDMTEDERRNASPHYWNDKGFWEDDCVFERIEPTQEDDCEWSFIPFPTDEQIKEAGGNE